MHWSKTRHTTFDDCPRKFFYENIAAERNPAIAKLKDDKSPPLLRHKVVRDIAITLTKRENLEEDEIDQIIASAKSILQKEIPVGHQLNKEMTIVENCLTSYTGSWLYNLDREKVVYQMEPNPIEFSYAGLNMMCVPELAIDHGDTLEVVNFRTGSQHFSTARDRLIRAGVMTCWVRAVLQVLDKPIIVTELYMKDACAIDQTTLSDDEVTAFIELAKQSQTAYSKSAKIRDFPSSVGQPCRFCHFKSICPEYNEFSETDYSIDGLLASIAGDNLMTPETSSDMRDVFLCHVSADKDSVVRPVARALESAGITYWLDEAEISWGDSIIRSVNDGLKKSRFVLCFLTPEFLAHGWPVTEMSAALNDEVQSGEVRVLPLMVADKESVVREFPFLKDKSYVAFDTGIPNVIKQLKKVMQKVLK